MYNFSEDRGVFGGPMGSLERGVGRQKGGRAFFLLQYGIRGRPYEIRKNYLIIRHRDAKISIAYLQKAEDVDS